MIELKTTMSKESTEAFIGEALRAEIAKHLPNKEALIAKVIDEALSKKKDSWDKKTIFAEAVEKMIREEAEATFKLWLEENRADVRKELLKKLTDRKQATLKEMVDGIVNSMGRFNVSTSVFLKAE